MLDPFSFFVLGKGGKVRLPGLPGGTFFKERKGRMSVEDKVRKVIAEKLDVDIDEVVPEASLVEDLGADSLDLVELMMSMEDVFDVDISDEQAEKLRTVKDVIDFLESL
jgi:acyl carrier protein